MNNNNNDYAKYISLGMEFGVTVLSFTFAGIFLDKKLGTTPLFSILGVFIGFISGMVLLFKIAKKFDKMSEDNKKKNNKNDKESNK
jgi:F0F1-type ATP synthase assembly protein I